MRAVTIVDGALVVAERPDPEPADTELLVATEAAGLNGADLLQRRGLYAPPPGVPADIPGLELVGTVIDTGRRATRFAAGDRVIALVGGGAQAELCVTDELTAMPAPPGVHGPPAGGFVEAFATAHDALVTQCDLRVGDRVLVTGAAGGVGTAAVQLAAVAGAAVTASCRHAALHPELLSLGAAVACLPEEVPAHGPYDVVLELVSGPGFAASLAALATDGRLCVIGVGAGARVEMDLLALMGRRARMSGSTLRARPLAERAAVVAAVERAVLPLLAEGRLRVPVAATYPLAEAEAAYDRFAAGAKLGKVVLVGGH